MISTLQLLDGRVRLGAYMVPMDAPEEPFPPFPELVLLADTGYALLTSPSGEYLEISEADPGGDLEDPDAIIFYFIANRTEVLDTTVGFDWEKVGTLPNARLITENFPLSGVAVMAPNQTQLAIPLVLNDRADLGQGFTLGIRISDPVDATIEVARHEVTI